MRMHTPPPFAPPPRHRCHVDNSSSGYTPSFFNTSFNFDNTVITFTRCFKKIMWVLRYMRIHTPPLFAPPLRHRCHIDNSSSGYTPSFFNTSFNFDNTVITFTRCFKKIMWVLRYMRMHTPPLFAPPLRHRCHVDNSSSGYTPSFFNTSFNFDNTVITFTRCFKKICEYSDIWECILRRRLHHRRI